MDDNDRYPVALNQKQAEELFVGLGMLDAIAPMPEDLRVVFNGIHGFLRSRGACGCSRAAKTKAPSRFNFAES